MSNYSDENTREHQRGKRKTAVISVAVAKGGVGKTTASVTIASGLAFYNKMKVLVIDIDPQGHVSGFFDFAVGSGTLGSVDFFKGRHHSECISHCRVYDMGGLIDIMITTDELTEISKALDVKEELDKHTERGESLDALSKMLDGISLSDHVASLAQAGIYDAIIIDCPPRTQSDPLVMEAWFSSDCVILPVVPGNRLSQEGLIKALRTQDNMEEQFGTAPEKLFVLQNMYKRVTKLGREDSAKMKEIHAANGCHLGIIPFDAKVDAALNIGETIFEFNHNSNAGREYKFVVARLGAWLLDYQSEYNEEVVT